jgi:hypothetical protein
VGNRSFSGFLLIEALCSLALFALVTLIFAHWYTTIVLLQQDGLRRLTALAQIQNYVENRYMVSIADTHEEKQQHTKQGITISHAPVLIDQPGFRLITITARWPSVYRQANHDTDHEGTELTQLCVGVAHAVSSTLS